MAVEPRVATMQNENRALQRRVQHLERTISGGSVDVEARAALADAAVSSKNRVWRQPEPPVDDGTFTSGDIWFDTDNLNAPYVWQRVAGLVTTSGASAKQGVVTTAGATGKLQKVTLAADTAYDVAVKVRRKSGAAVYLDVKDEVNNITVTAPRSAAEDTWVELATQITTGASVPTLMFAVRADAADPAATVYLADSLTLATPGGVNLLPNGGFEEGLGNWTTTGALVNPGATLAFSRDEAYAGAWVSAQDTAFLEASGNRIFRQTTAPTVAGVGAIKNGDLWFDTDDQNRPWIYENGAWVTVRDDKIQDAQNAAGLAQTTADGKNKIYVQGTAPPSTGRVYGDQWIDTANQNRIMTWTGSWTPAPLGAAGISSVGASVITGQLIAGQIATGAIIAGHIKAGEVTANALYADAVTSKNIRTGLDGVNRIVMGPAAYQTEPRLIFDVSGAANPSASAPSIRGASATQGTGLIIHGGTIGSFPYTETSIAMASSIGQPDRITLTAKTTIPTARTITAYLDASFGTYGRFQVTGDMTVNQRLGVDGLITSYAIFNGTGQTTVPNLRIEGSGSSVQYHINKTSHANSSIRYKHSVADITEVPELDPERLLQIRVRAFRFNDGIVSPEDCRFERVLPGMIAEEVRAVYPIAVDINPDGTAETWNDRFLLPGMLALIQRLHARVAALENR